MNQLTALIKALFKKYVLARYLIVGVANTSVCISMMSIGAYIGLNYLAYTALGTLVAILFSFFMNLQFTFRVQGQILTRLLLFFTINLTNLGLIELIEYVLIEHVFMPHILAIGCALSWSTLTGFLMNNYLVYRQKIFRPQMSR